MFKFWNCSLCVLMAISACQLYAKELTVKDLQGIQKDLKSFAHLSVDMQITNYDTTRNRERISTGKSHFSKPNLFRWMVKTPFAFEWLYDGSFLFNYDPESSSAVRYKTQGAQGREISQIVDAVLNFEVLLERYDVERANQVKDEITVLLRPKNAKKGSQSKNIELKIDVKQKYVSYLKLGMRGKKYMAIQFRNPTKTPISGQAYKLAKTVKISEGL